MPCVLRDVQPDVAWYSKFSAVRRNLRVVGLGLGLPWVRVHVVHDQQDRVGYALGRGHLQPKLGYGIPEHHRIHPDRSRR